MGLKVFFSVLAVSVAISGCAKSPPPAPNHLIMLTETADGQADASFMEVDTLEECESRASAAMKVFPMAKIKYIRHYCTHTNIKFEPFLHNPEPEGPSYVFGLNFVKDGKVLSKVSNFKSMTDCENKGKQVCVISYQNIVSGE